MNNAIRDYDALGLESEAEQLERAAQRADRDTERNGEEMEAFHALQATGFARSRERAGKRVAKLAPSLCARCGSPRCQGGTDCDPERYL